MMTELQTREDHLVCLALAVADAYVAWEDRTELPEGLFRAIDQCVTEWMTGDIPGECRELLPLIMELQREWQDYSLTASEGSWRQRPQFWAVIGRLENVFYFIPTVTEWEPDYESVAQLLSGEYDGTKWSEAQVAIEYSWEGKGPFLRDGIAQPHLVRREAKEPGSVLGPDFIHPKVAYLRAQATRYQSAVRMRADRLRAAGVRLKQDDAPPVAVAESIEELFSQGLNDEQVAINKCLTVPEVAAKRKAWAAQIEADDETLRELVSMALQRDPALTNAEIAKELGIATRSVAAVRQGIDA